MHVTTPTFLHAMEQLRRPMPEDFIEVAPPLSMDRLCKIYGAGTSTIQRWRKEAGIQPLSPGANANRPLPEDFRERAPKMSQRDAKFHYSAATETVRRWYRETGITPNSGKNARRNSKSVNWGARQPIEFGAHGDGSLAGSAANHLRRIGYSNVFRAIILDKAKRAHLPDEGREFYSVSGKGFMHESALVALAEARGFRDAA